MNEWAIQIDDSGHDLSKQVATIRVAARYEALPARGRRAFREAIKAAQKAARYMPESLRNVSCTSVTENVETPVSARKSGKTGVWISRKVDDIGLERLPDAKAETVVGPELYASLYARDFQLARLIECWPRLTDEDRQALADHAEHLVAGRIEFAT